MSRPSWDEYGLNLAAVVATRATCPRRRVGAVLMQNNRVLACGYNGSAPGEDHCDDVGRLMVDGHCKRTIHAEENVFADWWRRSCPQEDDGDLVLYTTITPCPNCRALAESWGVTRFLWSEDYP